MRVNTYLYSLLGALILCSCGIESTVPSDAAPSSEAERAVFITNVTVTASGSIVTCELNDALISPGVQVPIFLEYQGTEIERTMLENEADFTFAEYNPPTDGDIVCVVEFADAEFESEAQTLQRIP